MKKLSFKVLFLLSIMFAFPVGMLGTSFLNTNNTYAVVIGEDNVGNSEENGSSSGNDSYKGQGSTSDESGVAEYLKGYQGVTEEDLEASSEISNILTDGIGYITGLIVVVIVALIPLITVLDLLYISFPPIRPVLYSMDGNGAEPGMRQRRWVSDEAVACVGLMQNAQMATSPNSPMNMGGGFSSMQYGGNMMGGYGSNYGGNMMRQNSMDMMNGQNSHELATQSVIVRYFKKRTIFIIMFAIALIILTSSIIMDTGINLAKWIWQILEYVNSVIPA